MGQVLREARPGCAALAGGRAEPVEGWAEGLFPAAGSSVRRMLMPGTIPLVPRQDRLRYLQGPVKMETWGLLFNH